MGDVKFFIVVYVDVAQVGDLKIFIVVYVDVAQVGDVKFFIVVYVDDLILVCNHQNKLLQIK